MYSFFLNVDKCFVINLKEDTFRKNHVQKEFIGKCKNYEIIEAVSYNDKIVKKQYTSNNVKSFPPCFRCNVDVCDHFNNFITPKQVANFLSFKKIMEIVVERNLNKVVIFEDDLKFNFFSKISFKNLSKFIKNNERLNNQSPFIVRIGSHTIVNKIFYLKLLLTRQNTFVLDNVEDMANPCFLINKAYAEIFLKEFKNIEDTSDNFIHRKLVEKYNILNYSIYPFPVRQLSYGRKKNTFSSTIASQNTSESFTDKYRVENKSEYQNLLNKWIKT